jgi:hypothetical protein
MLFKEIINVYSENRTKPVYIVNIAGTYALKGYTSLSESTI